MKKDIIVPAAGESVTEATLAEWSKQNGDYVEQNEVLLVLETDKASLELVAEQAGVLKIDIEEGTTVKVGTVVGSIDTSAQKTTGASSNDTSHAHDSHSSSTETTHVDNSLETTSQSNVQQKTLHPDLKNTLSPAVNKIVNENHLNPSSIAGSGRDGRLTKADVLTASANKSSANKRDVTSDSPALELPTPSAGLENKEWREKMSRLRKTIARRLVEAQHTAAILTTFNEIDMGPLMDLRSKYKDTFEKKHGVRLGFMGFFVKAVIEALKEFPAVNASIDGDDLIYRNFYNVGMAVGTEKGLVVPILKNAEKLSIADIEKSIKVFAGRAKEGKLSMDDLSGGTFTISNGGVYGSLMSTPILNPPQTGILGLHKIEERPIAINKQVVIRPMMYVALSYDHRVIDGSESVRFLVRVKDCIEDPSRMLLDV